MYLNQLSLKDTKVSRQRTRLSYFQKSLHHGLSEAHWQRTWRCEFYSRFLLRRYRAMVWLLIPVTIVYDWKCLPFVYRNHSTHHSSVHQLAQLSSQNSPQYPQSSHQSLITSRWSPHSQSHKPEPHQHWFIQWPGCDCREFIRCRRLVGSSSQ